MHSATFRVRVAAIFSLSAFALLAFLSHSASAQTVAAISNQPARSTAPHRAAAMRTTYFGSIKARFEDYNWFPAKTDNGAYTFGGTVLRLGVLRQTPADDLMLEVEQPTLIGIPSRATGPSPVGNSGAGGNYFSANHNQNASLFIKQLYVRFKQIGGEPADSFRIGRFEFADGAETTPADPALAYLKQQRINQRLIAQNSYTLVGHTYTGFQFSNDTRLLNLNAAGILADRGSYSLNGWDILDKVKVGYVNAAYPQPGRRAAAEGRLFGIYYEDERGKVVKADNRPSSVRSADHNGIHIGTLGGNYLKVWDLGPGRMDALFWGAGQIGDWGKESQAAYAYDAELGYQLPKTPLKPWFRFGYAYFSGDGNGSNNTHGTFIPLLTTSRTYARFPFYTEANLKDLFGQVILRPGARTIIRADVHRLSLADDHDLWYTGSGAFENLNFGYTGRPSGGHSDLGTLYDISVDYNLQKNTDVGFYIAYANGGSVETATFRGREASFAFLEVNTRF